METSDGIQMDELAVDLEEQNESQDEHPQTDKKKLSFWSTHIRLAIDETAWRDHLALERTYLAYIRTASAYAQFGVLLAQLFRLNVSSKGNKTPTTLRIGSALGATSEGIAIVILLVGAVYWARQQKGLVNGTTHAGGWHAPVVLGLSICLLIIIFALLVAADEW